MNARRIAVLSLLTAAAVVAGGIAGCSKKTSERLVPNIRPEVRLTAAPFDTSRATPYFYAYRINWIANDPDGRVDYFLYAIDPPESVGVRVKWVRTQKNEEIIFFTADSSDVRTGNATHPHVFALCAVDNRGDTSDVIRRGFYSYTQCPTVTIVDPRLYVFGAILVTPSVRIQWTGTDPDGQLTSKPVKYKYIMLGPGSAYTADQAARDPNALRDYYAYDWASHGLPGPWAGWDSTGADVTTMQFKDLTPGGDYVFVVVSFDEAGAFSPVFSFSQNMLRLKPGYASTLGPIVIMFNEFFYFKYQSGGWTMDDRAAVKLEVPYGQPITFNWTAEPPKGALMEYYQWMVDGDPSDETIRTAVDDSTHWSDPSVLTTSVTVGGFEGDTQHDFWVQAADNNGLKSLGHVRMRVVRATLERPLMIVKDMRLIPESGTPLSAGCLPQPIGDWPNMAEVDSFFFARGGVPWQCTTTLANSEPGIFSGYSYDVFHTTKIGTLDKTVRLDTLGKYKNVVWITDPGVTNAAPTGGQYALRYMSAPGRVNTLGAYMRQGGRVWIVGGGAAFALCKDMFNSGNNDSYAFTYSNRMPTELVPGRFMYDIMHWRSELQAYTVGNAKIKRSARADSIMRYGGWTMPTFEGVRSNPNYSRLPLTMDAKTPGTDALPATRVGNDRSFYRTNAFYVLEYLSQPNSIIEDVNASPVIVQEVATLDTLMRTEAALAQSFQAYEVGGLIPGTNTPKPNSVIGTPVMTYYHGLEFPAAVFSGFDLWSYQRGQCVGLVDFVLQEIFHLTKGPVPAAVPARVARGARAAWEPPAVRARPVPAGRGTRVTPAPAATLRPGSHE